MILEAVRILTDWLNDGTNGVNAVRNSVPRDTGVSVFPAVTVLDSTRDARVARGLVPTGITLPALLVSPADQPTQQTAPSVRPWPPDAEVTVLIRYATSALDTASAERDASQTIRAIWRVLGQLMVTTAGSTARTRNSVQLVTMPSIQAATLYESDQDTVVTGGVLVTCRVRDLWAVA